MKITMPSCRIVLNRRVIPGRQGARALLYAEDAGIMLTGKVLSFDEVRGYGFIAPDGGGEDVFVHANVLGDDKYVFVPGLRVEFEASDGDRGPKAYAVRLLRGESPAPAATPVMSPDVRVPQDPAAPAVAWPTAAPARGVPPASADAGGEELCDVLTAHAFSQEMTEIILRSAPAVTAAQILGMRDELVAFGRQHGWIEGGRPSAGAQPSQGRAATSGPQWTARAPVAAARSVEQARA
jgi:CspA family cold shock protein